MNWNRTLFLGVILLLVKSGAGQEFIGPHGYLTFEAEISDKDSAGRRGTFDLHHFNLFGNYLLNDKTRVFGEIEWEHGTDTEGSETSGGEAGFVRLERAWFEYELSEKFKLRLGKFLTPYGIYNEIHDAAPAYDTSILPQSLYGKHENPFGTMQRFYAKFSIGVQAKGVFEIGSSSFQYQVLLTNGRGGQPFEQDDNRDKGLGLRLLADLPTAGLIVGYSVYSDRNGLAFHTRQTSQVWDLRFEYKQWRLSGEYARSSLGARKATSSMQIANAGYAEVAYQLFGRQTVLIRYDLFDPDNRQSGGVERDLTLGTSLQILKQALVKAETHFWTVENGSPENYVLAIASLAVVF